MIQKEVVVKGFTLIELLISLSISSFSILFLSSYINQNNQLIEKQESLYYLQDEANNILQYINLHLKEVNSIGNIQNENIKNIAKEISYKIDKNQFIIFRNKVPNSKNMIDSIASLKIEKGILSDIDKLPKCTDADCIVIFEPNKKIWKTINHNKDYKIIQLEFKERGSLIETKLKLESLSGMKYQTTSLINKLN